MQSPDQNTIVFDITTSSRWSGRPVGIIRVERELARFASTHAGREIVFSVFDNTQNTFFRVKDEYIGRIIQGTATIAPWRSVPSKGVKGFLRAPRRYLMNIAAEILEREDIGGLRRTVGAMILKFLMKKKDKAFLKNSMGPANIIPFNVATSEPIELGLETTLVSVGLDWDHKNLSAIYRIKREKKFRYVAMCYDVIPWMFPHFYGALIDKFMLPYFTNMSWTADTVICISHRTARDYTSFCDHFLIPTPRIEVFPLGSDIVSTSEIKAEEEIHSLPGQLEPGRFILFVSTIEPRKNHRLLYNAWERMTETGRNEGIKLVWVGRRGWMTDDLLLEVGLNPIVKNNLLMLVDLSDELLNVLYRHCLFTVFPSFYEGYGLPVVESLRYGKVCVAARTGNIPEIAGDLIPLLDPLDTMAWIDTMSRLISNPTDREMYEHRIREQFVAPTWERAAKIFFALI